MTTDGKRKYQSWADAPRVFVTLAACPNCGGVDHRIVRSEANGDGSVSRRAICESCSARFFVVAEIPENGNPLEMPE